MFAYCLNNPVVYLDVTGCSVTTPPMITGGLNLPTGGGIPIVIDGQSYQYAISYNSNGELYEYWFDTDGNLVWIRHNSDHRTPWKHKNPHDHEGGKDNNGNNTLKSGPLPVDEKFKTPNDTSRSNETSAFGELAGWALLGYGLYKLGKFAFATAIATPTGGLSYVWAAVA